MEIKEFQRGSGAGIHGQGRQSPCHAVGIVVSICLIEPATFLNGFGEKRFTLYLNEAWGKVNDFLNDMDMVFKFLRGQLLDIDCRHNRLCCFNGHKADFAVLLGCFVGLQCDPYSPIFGAVPAVIVALFTGGSSNNNFDVFVVIQQIDGNLIYLRLSGQAPVSTRYVLLAVTGGYFWGLLGMVLAVPVTACLKLSSCARPRA